MVLLDEPTASLAPEGAALVGDAIARLSEGRTVIMAVHRLALALSADRVVVLEEGRVVERGSPADLTAGAGAFRAQLDAAGARA